MTYTFILDFRGGTYIEQIDAINVIAATHVWAKKVANEPDIKHLNGEDFLKAFYYNIEVFQPIEIEECTNVWNLSFLMGRFELDVHIIKTSDSPEPAPPVSALRAEAAT